ncbi:MAG: protein TolQ [Bdellovibrionales bacterium]|nr:protein TolQ [Bdellovibrionales bacterium]
MVRLLLILTTASFVWAENSEVAETAPTSSSMEIIYSILHANILVQITFVILIFMSVFSWGIILTKRKMFHKIELYNAPFQDIFQKANNLQSIYEVSQKYSKSSLANIFKTGYKEIQKLSKSKLAESETTTEGLLSGLDNLERSLRKAVMNEISAMEEKLSFLATTGTVSPFIGLFGTVFGIMDAFQSIGKMGSASLAVVAPGISEALIATGVGLFAAIPASVFYNHYVTKIRKMELMFSNFTTDFLNIAKRNFFKDS